MHNLGTVFRFEIIRTLKKKSFWIMALSFPLIISAIFGIIFFSNQATQEAAEKAQNQEFSIAITDQTGLISPQIINAIGAEIVTDKQKTIDRVTSGELDAYFYYPKNLEKDGVEIYGEDVGLFKNSRYQGVAEQLLKQSVTAKVNPTAALVLQERVAFNSTTYKEGAPYNGFKELIAPGLFLVLFYFLIAMFGSQMLTSTTEEKENRVIEMILTTIEARVLIIGKILSLLVLAAIQITILLIPTIAIYTWFGDQLKLPDVDLSNIPLDPMRISIGAAIFALSFLLFTGLLVAIGAAVPTAKEAGSFFGLVMVLIFGPLYAVTLFVSQPESPIVTFLSFFPLTAPIPLMLRNAVGNLPPTDALIAIVILAISATIALAVAIRLFRYGALEYSKRLSISMIFKKRA